MPAFPCLTYINPSNKKKINIANNMANKSESLSHKTSSIFSHSDPLEFCYLFWPTGSSCIAWNPDLAFNSFSLKILGFSPHGE